MQSKTLTWVVLAIWLPWLGIGSVRGEVSESSEPYEDLPAHYLLLIDTGGSIKRIPNYKEELHRLVTQRIPDLITHPGDNGITLPPFRLGKDYLSVIFFGIPAPKAQRHFANLLHPERLFWADPAQFQILGERIRSQAFEAHFSAISLAFPLSLPLIKQSRAKPELFADPALAQAAWRFSRTVGIVLSDTGYNDEASSLDELTYLATAGRVKGMEATRKTIQEVRRFYDYDLNAWMFLRQGKSKRFLIALREFVPKAVSLPRLLAKPSAITLERFAPTSKELYYRGEMTLNFLFPKQSPLQYYAPRELRWKRDGAARYHRVALHREHLQTGPVRLPVQFAKSRSHDPIGDAQKAFRAELYLTYDFQDPVYGFHAQTFQEQVRLSPVSPPPALPLLGMPISDGLLMRLAPLSVSQIRHGLLGVSLAVGCVLMLGMISYAVRFFRRKSAPVPTVSTDGLTLRFYREALAALQHEQGLLQVQTRLTPTDPNRPPLDFRSRPFTTKRRRLGDIRTRLRLARKLKTWQGTDLHARLQTIHMRDPAVGPGEWNKQQAVRNLIVHTPELSALYGALGYFADIDRQAEQLMQELKNLIRAVIPDFAAFQQALQDVQTHIEKQDRREYAPEFWAKDPSQQANIDLLQAVIEAGSEYRQVLALLNRDPIHEHLPFVEQLPFYQEGTLVWRTPVEHSLIRKRPTDSARFTFLLDAIENLLQSSPLPRHGKEYREVLEAVARVRRDLQNADGYLPTSLRLLEQKLAACVQHPPHPDARAKCIQLDALLGDLLYVRHMYGWDGQQRQTVNRIDLAILCRNLTQNVAQRYLSMAWMQMTWLTTHILTTLFEAELALLQHEAADTPSPHIALVRLIRDEVASGRYDGEETTRRLREQEERGLYVHSLIYALLRLPSAAAPQALRRAMRSGS